MHPVRTVIYDLAKKEEPRHLENDVRRGTLTYLDTSDERLSYGLEFTPEEHPRLAAIEAYVLPDLGIRVSRFKHRCERLPDDYDYYIDIVSVVEKGDLWRVRDLYLDILVFDGYRVKILDTDEYLAALQEGHLTAAEVAHALTALHAFVNGLAQHEYNLDAYLQVEGVTLTWRKLKSTR